MLELRYAFVIASFLFQVAFTQDGTMENILKKEPAFSRLVVMIEDAKMMAYFGKDSCNEESNNRCPTFMAPNDEAWGSKNTRTVLQERAAINKHIIFDIKDANDQSLRLDTKLWDSLGAEMGLLDVGFGKGRAFSNSQAPMYTFMHKSETGMVYYVNHAKLVKENLKASNGMIHMIDKVLVNDNSKTDITSYMIKSDLLEKTWKLWTKFIENDVTQTYRTYYTDQPKVYGTYILVANDGWNDVSSAKMEEILKDANMLKEVLQYQVAPNQIVFTEWTEVKPVISMRVGMPNSNSDSVLNDLPEAVMRKEGKKVTISANGVTVNVLGSTIQLKQLNVILVDAPLGFVYRTKDEALTRLSSSFSQSCRTSSTCKQLFDSASKQSTILAPSNSAWSSIPSSKRENLYRNLFVPTQLTASNIVSGTSMKVDGVESALRFKEEESKLYIERRDKDEGYTRAELTGGSTQTTDGGVIQVVSSVPGFPVDTMKQMLMKQQPTVKKYFELGFPDALEIGGPYTCIVPTDAAFEKMKSNSVGQSLLGDKDRMEYILRRLCFPLKLIVQDLTVGTLYQVPTSNYAFTRESLLLRTEKRKTNIVANFDFEGTKISVSGFDGAYRATNGWWYVTDTIIYNAEDLNRKLCTSDGCFQGNE